jgi:hypothetical protein
MPKSIITTGILFAGAVALAGSAFAADLPKSTVKILKKAGISTAALGDIDKELAIPKSMIEAAKKEGTLKFRLTYSPKHSDKMLEVFNE